MATATGENRRRQFTIGYLLFLTLFVAIAIAPIVYWGMPGLCPAVLLGLVGWAVLHTPYRGVAAMIGLTIVAALVLPSVLGVGPRSPRPRCTSHLHQIAQAIRKYESDNGHFPPPYIADDKGTPIHSWRVLILPYLGEKDLYDKYDFSKPWNHPYNLALAVRMPSVYRCPSDTSPLADVTTTYVAVVGNQTVWPPSSTRIHADVRDGLSNTILLLESTASRTHWMAPSDASFSSIGPVTKDGATLLLVSPHPGVSLCSFCDARVVPVSQHVTADRLEAMLTVDGGESVDVESQR